MKRTILTFMLILVAVVVSAGDIAVLENLGFSTDGRYFMFGQHVLVTEEGKAYAELAVVDVPRNDFVSGGWKKNSWDHQVLPNQSSRGALYELMSQSVDLKKRYGISHLEQGRLLYTRENGDDEMMSTPESDEVVPTLNFRDFERGSSFSLALYVQPAEGEDIASAFHVEMAVTDSNGAINEYTVGREGYMRSGITGYSIVRVWVGPDGKSLVIVLAKEFEDLSIRYMVETLKLK